MTDDEWAALRKRLVRLAALRFGYDAAEDIVQEAIVSFLTRARDLEILNAAGYLYRSVINEGSSRWRRLEERRFRQALRAAPPPDGETVAYTPGYEPDLAQMIDTASALAKAKAALRPGELEQILGYAEERAAAAERLGIKATTLRVRVFRARRRLRERLVMAA